jgi:hypothetical protein
VELPVFLLQVLMGIFYYVKSIALSEDLPGVEEGGFESPEEFYKIADRGYVQVCIYVYLFVLALSQKRCLTLMVLVTECNENWLFQGF